MKPTSEGTPISKQTFKDLNGKHTLHFTSSHLNYKSTLTFISWTDEFITSLGMSINGNWNYNSFHTKLLVISALFYFPSHTDLLFWPQHPMFCIYMNFHFIKNSCCSNKRFSRTARKSPFWTCAKSDLTISLDLFVYLISCSKKSKTDSNTGSTMPCLLWATETDVLASWVWMQHLDSWELCWNAFPFFNSYVHTSENMRIGHTDTYWFLLAVVWPPSQKSRDLFTMSHHLNNNQPHVDGYQGWRSTGVSKKFQNQILSSGICKENPTAFIYRNSEKLCGFEFRNRTRFGYLYSISLIQKTSKTGFPTFSPRTCMVEIPAQLTNRLARNVYKCYHKYPTGESLVHKR